MGSIPARHQAASILMKFILLCHPEFTNSQSMPRFANSLKQSLEGRGYEVDTWAPKAFFFNFFKGTRLQKWGGYVDQYLIFPFRIRQWVRKQSADTLYVFCDQALGPWVPALKDRPHVIHCHDLLALRSAMGLVPENPTSFTGKIYQRFILRGFAQGQNFIAISSKTKQDLVEFGDIPPDRVQVVLNELNYPYAPVPMDQAQAVLARHHLPQAGRGIILHVGGRQWYKNRPGVVALYAEYARRTADPLPLWMVGPAPRNDELQRAVSDVPANGAVLFFQGLENEVVEALYSLAKVFVFPSLAEGFGWPIIEAQACGCPVITTAEPPMNEVGGEHTTYISRLYGDGDAAAWARQGADQLERLVNLSEPDRQQLRARCLSWSQRFKPGTAFDAYLRIYQQVLAQHAAHAKT